MGDFLTLDVSVSERSIPAPPIRLDTTTEFFPTIGPFSIGAVDFAGASFDLPSVSIPSIPIPDVSLFTTDAQRTFTLNTSLTVPTVTLPELSIATEPFAVPFTDETIQIINPAGSSLSGGSVGFESRSISESVTVSVPVPSLVTTTRTIGGTTVTFPDITVPGFETGGLSIPQFDLPNVTVPTGVSLDGTVSIPDPAGIDVDASLDVDGIAGFVLDPIPADFLANPAEWTFFAALDETTNHITEDVARALRDVTEGFFDLLMDDETKERLREQNRDN